MAPWSLALGSKPVTPVLGTGVRTPVLGTEPVSTTLVGVFRGSTGAPGTSTVKTTDPVAIGTPSATRNVVVTVLRVGGAGSNVVSITAGGVPMTLVQSASSIATYRAVVPTGTTAVIVCTLSVHEGILFHVWTVEGTITRAAGVSRTQNTLGVSTSVTAYTGGYIAASMLGQDQNMLTGLTWSNATRDPFTDNVTAHQAAHATHPAGPVTIGVTGTNVGTRQLLLNSFGRDPQPPNVADDFNRANGVMGTTSVGGKTWVAGGGAGMAIATNRAAWTGAANGHVVVDTGFSDGYTLQFTVTFTGSPQYPILVIPRGTSATVYARLFRDQTANLWILDNGAGGSSQSFAFATDLVSGDVIRVDVMVNDFYLYVNSVFVTSFTSTLAAGGTFQGFGGAGGMPTNVDNFTVSST